VSSGFGERLHPIHKIIKFHAGLDFTAPQGTEIYATGDGRVEFADYATNGYGIHVILDHGFDYKTLYGHLSSLKVRVRRESETRRLDRLGGEYRAKRRTPFALRGTQGRPTDRSGQLLLQRP
jgi:hypothetical protein